MEDFLDDTFFGRLKSIRHAAELAVGAAGALVGLFGLGQSSAYHKHNLQWAEIDYFLQVRQVHIDTLNNMREDLRDMYELDGRKIDTNMIVATLLLAIGFGFVVEGTFPASDPGKSDAGHQTYEDQHNMRVVYAVVAAFALLCPFWSMLALIECRRRLDFFMHQFNDKFYRMLKHRFQLFLAETRSTDILHGSNLVRYTEGLPQEPHPALARVYSSALGCRWRCRGKHRRAGAAGSESATDYPEQECHEPGDFEVILALHSHYATWWYNWCSRCLCVSRVCTWFAMIFNVLCCALLLGMYFQYSYPDTPEMWTGYSFLVLLGLLLAMVLTGLANCTGPRIHTRTQHIDHHMNFIPGWMTEDPSQPLLQA
uniref:Uncharacterized protein n=1 Tax=Alexandrium monilatum TaxID=311494 RepID=A0A7S4W1E0_9DINO|mmetsp:Transcript_2168/g.6861  ORF Transcript_2168/g.6861 Transcript_2168/m.6861 type:complete len:369 (+) Transcript_2168:131-1237(+)